MLLLGLAVGGPVQAQPAEADEAEFVRESLVLLEAQNIVQEGKIDALDGRLDTLTMVMLGGFAFTLAVTTLLFSFVMHQLNALQRRVDNLQQSLDRLQETQQAILMHLAGVERIPGQKAQPPKKPRRQVPVKQAASPKRAARRRTVAVASRAAL